MVPFAPIRRLRTARTDCGMGCLSHDSAALAFLTEYCRAFCTLSGQISKHEVRDVRLSSLVVIRSSQIKEQSRNEDGLYATKVFRIAEIYDNAETNMGFI